MSSIDFQVSDLSVTSTLSALEPTLAAATAVTDLTGHNAVIQIDISEADIRNVFLFKSDSSDLAAEDDEFVTATTADTAANFPVPILGTHKVADSTHDDAATGDDSNQMDVSASVQTVAADYVRYFSKQLLGQSGLADIFNNEAALVTDVEGNDFAGTTANDIRGKALDQAVMTKLFDNLFSASDNEGAARLSDTAVTELSSGPDNDGVSTFKFPFKANDTIRYHVTLQHAAVTFGGEAKSIADRKYLVVVNVN